MSACDRCLALSELTVALAAVAAVPPGAPGRTPADLVHRVPGISAARARAIARHWDGWDARSVRGAALGAGLIGWCRCDADYPQLLCSLADPPPVVWLRGDPAVLRACPGQAAAIVGTRRPTLTGRDAARRLAAAVGRAEGVTISGMARGIDAAAHDGALSVGAPTIAVLASGADCPTPTTNAGLYGRILERGAVIAEMPPGARPHRWSFPARNRLIAALAAATVVVEAPLRSGALITVTHAADLGRAIYAVPGSLAADCCEGSNRLLVDGAGALVDAADLTAALGLATAGAPRRPDDGPGAIVHDALRRRPLSLSEVERAAVSLGPGEVELALLDLELAGWVVRRADGRYALAAA
ncbi:MAG: DNA-processing protein DprA [Patulibacter sp.]